MTSIWRALISPDSSGLITMYTKMANADSHASMAIVQKKRKTCSPQNRSGETIPMALRSLIRLTTTLF